MKAILFGVLAPILLLLSVDSVSACWCRREVVDTETKFRAAVSEAVKQSKAVFVGEIVEQNRSQLQVKVEKVWKGKIGEQIILVTHDWQDGDLGSIDSCAYSFIVGRKYLIYADKVNGELVTSKCSRTLPSNDAQQDLNELDRVRPRRSLPEDKMRGLFVFDGEIQQALGADSPVNGL